MYRGRKEQVRPCRKVLQLKQALAPRLLPREAGPAVCSPDAADTAPCPAALLGTCMRTCIIVAHDTGLKRPDARSSSTGAPGRAMAARCAPLPALFAPAIAEVCFMMKKS